MRRFILPAGAAIAALAPAVALAKPPTPGHTHAYEHVYREVVHELGPRVPGRNIVKDGVARGRAATDADVVASISVLERMLAPSASNSSSSAAPVAATSSTGASGGVPACASESGTNYSTGSSNTNGSTGATGRYQIEPSTAAAYGCSLATPAGQDACAQVIYEHQGASAWVGCGG